MSHLSPRKLLNFIDKKHRKLTRKPTYLGNPGLDRLRGRLRRGVSLGGLSKLGRLTLGFLRKLGRLSLGGFRNYRLKEALVSDARHPQAE